MSLIVHPTCSRRVIAKVDIDAKKLSFLPMSPTITLKSGKGPPNAIDLGQLISSGGVAVNAWASPYFKKAEKADEPENTSKKDNPEFFAPFWIVSSTTDVKQANMVFELATVSLKCDESFEIKVITLVNNKAVKKGQDLCFYRAADANKYPGLEELAPSSKKRRVSKS